MRRSTGWGGGPSDWRGVGGLTPCREALRGGPWGLWGEHWGLWGGPWALWLSSDLRGHVGGFVVGICPPELPIRWRFLRRGHEGWSGAPGFLCGSQRAEC